VGRERERERVREKEGESIRETAFVYINTPTLPHCSDDDLSHPLALEMSRRGVGGGQDAFNYLGAENVGQGRDRRRYAAG